MTAPSPTARAREIVVDYLRAVQGLTYTDKAGDAIRKANADKLLAALTAAGLAIVPIEPTKEMQRAFDNAMMGQAEELHAGIVREPTSCRTWRAMLSAANPTPPAAPPQQIGEK